MGLLVVGSPLDWPQAKPYADHVRDHGIAQLINMYEATKDKKGDTLLWGDEVELMVVDLDPDEKTARLSLRQSEILNELAVAEGNGDLDDCNATFHPEYGRYMLETTPARPFSGDFKELLTVEANMAQRRKIARAHMAPNETPLTLTSYPMLGTPGQFCTPPAEPRGPVSQSWYVPDSIINPHVRFPTLTANIRQRRGSKVAINVPVFKDERTPSPFWDRSAGEVSEHALQDHIHMDAMAFGMGCCCLQLTFQATDVDEARNLYDQLAPLTPIMLALTAASPVFKGLLSDQDARWNVIAGSVDDRNRVERGLDPPDADWQAHTHNSAPVIPKSRYDSIDRYLSRQSPVLGANRAHYNDTDLVVNTKALATLKAAGFDDLLADHFAHLFIRDPLVIFEESIDQDDTVASEHFENIQSTNWQTLRFKPPTAGSPIGWRVEFRPMEVQFTDFENAAFSVFIVLVTRVLVSYKLNLYMPISKIDQNMRVAHDRDAVAARKFWFRTDLSPDSGVDAGQTGSYAQLSIDHIVNGHPGFVGLIPLIRDYLETMTIDMDTLCRLNNYLDLVSRRASGALVTPATWIRDFVRNHPAYERDSRVLPEINYDLMVAVNKITQGQLWDSDASALLKGCVQ